jgi:hypothetical protein
MNNLAKISILLIIVLSSSTFGTQPTRNRIISSAGTLTINAPQDSLAMDTTMQEKSVDGTNIDSLTVGHSAIDTTLYRSTMLYQDSFRNLKKTYNKDVFKFKYDPFKEKMKEPWIGDILKDFFR